MKKKSRIKTRKFVIYVKKNLVLIKNIKKSEIIVIIQKNIIISYNICNLRYKIPKEIPVVFHNGSTYNYHFIIEQLAKEFKGKLECLGENTEKYVTFSVPIETGHDNGKTITYKLKLIDSYRLMQSSLSSLVHNLSEVETMNETRR